MKTSAYSMALTVALLIGFYVQPAMAQESPAICLQRYPAMDRSDTEREKYNRCVTVGSPTSGGRTLEEAVATCVINVRQITGVGQFDAYSDPDGTVSPFGTERERFLFDKCMSTIGWPLHKASAE